MAALQQDNDKIKGMLYAVCLGDALGLPYEFRHNRSGPYTGRLADNRLERTSRWGQNTQFDFGQLSDDSEMTIILARHIHTHDMTVVPNDLIMDYMAWANHPTTCCLGRNTIQLFKGVKTLRGQAKRYEKINQENQSNGHLMRATPLALVDEQYWDAECRLTNPHPTCLFVNHLYLTMVRSALRGSDKQTILHEAFETCHGSNIADVQLIADQVLNDGNRDIDSQKGWTIHAMYCVLYCFRKFDAFADVMQWIISKRGDTDTNGAIVCGLFGAYYGHDALVEQQLENINLMLACTTENGNKVRPEEYRASSILEIIS